MKKRDFEKNPITRYSEFESIVKEFMLLKDPYLLRLICACIIGNQMDMYPIWLMIVASSSGGKSMALSIFDKVVIEEREIIFPISDLTANSFASGFKSNSNEASLLYQMPPGGIFMFKDWTTQLSKRYETQQEIMGQMRQIYDGHFVKRVGNGPAIEWSGKVGAMAASTEVVFEHQERMSAMGDRFIMYSIIPADARDVMKLTVKKRRDGIDPKEEMEYMQDAAKSYFDHVFANVSDDKFLINEKDEDEILDIADFCTRARSGVIENKFGRDRFLEFVPSHEQPMRLADQILSLGAALQALDMTEPASVKSKGKDLSLKEMDKEMLFKVAFDSIPIKRRMVIKRMAQYKEGITTKGAATELGYQTVVVNGWLTQLNGLGICTREAHSGNQGDLWKLVPKYAPIVIKQEKISPSESMLEAEEEIDDEQDAWDAWESHDDF